MSKSTDFKPFLRELMPDLFIIFGFFALITGVYRLYGLEISLILGGTMTLASGIYSYFIKTRK